MVAIARAVSFEARLVIMDEPTSSLDEAEVAVLLRTIRQLKAEGVAVIFVSHKLDELYEVCDRVTIMRDGRTVAVSPMADMSKLQLVAAMLGRDLAEVEEEGRDRLRGRRRQHRRRTARRAEHRDRPPVHDVEPRHPARRNRRPRRAARFGPHRNRARDLRRRPQAVPAASRSTASRPISRSRAEAIAAGMGYCSEDRKSQGIVPDMTVAENLTLALMPALTRSGMLDEAKQREIVERFIKEIGIKCSGPNQKIRELSGGNQQKVLLARWLCMNPKLLILDEPTRGIDVGAKAEIQSLIRRLASDGLGVLMISSELEEIVEGADRVFVLREGRTVAELDRENITESGVMHAMAHGHDARRPAQEGASPVFDRAAFFQRYGVGLALVLLIVFNLAVTPNFATSQTLAVNLTQVCTIVIVGVGMTLVIATGGIDLSVGSLMAIAGALSPMFFTGQLFPIPNLYVGIALGIVIPDSRCRRFRAVQRLADHQVLDPADHRHAGPVHRRARHRAGVDQRRPAGVQGAGVPGHRHRPGAGRAVPGLDHAGRSSSSPPLSCTRRCSAGRCWRSAATRRQPGFRAFRWRASSSLST